jgi:Flp pilus assembly pilin Flp
MRHKTETMRREGRLQTIQLLNNVHKEESGQDIIEYILIAAFITVGVIATIGLIAGKVSGYWTSLKNHLT